MKRCGECGGKEVSIKSAKGKLFSYKEYEKVPLMSDYDVLTCEKCENIILSNKNISELDKILEDQLYNKQS